MAYTYLEPGHLPVPDQNEPADIAAIEQRAQQRASDLLVGRTTAQRDALSGTDLWTGRRIYNTTTQLVEVYSGTAWKAAGVTAHSALTGLTSGDPHTQYIPKSAVAAKGDLLAGSAAGVVTRLPKAADGRVVSYDGTTGTGLASRDLDGDYIRKNLVTGKGLVVGTAASTPAFKTAAVSEGRMLMSDPTQADGFKYVDIDNIIVLGVGDLRPSLGGPGQAGNDYWPGWGLDPAAVEMVSGYVHIPTHWASFHIDVYGYKTVTGTGDLSLRSGRRVMTPGDSADTTSVVGPIITAAVAANNTITSIRLESDRVYTPTNDPFMIGVQRRGSDATDTYAADWIVMAVKLTKAS